MKLKTISLVVAAVLALVVVPLRAADEGKPQEQPDVVAVAEKLMETFR